MQHSSVVQVVDAIRNTRDVDTNLHGLNQLRRALESGGNLAFLQQYTFHAGGFDDLQGVWDAQLTVRITSQTSLQLVGGGVPNCHHLRPGC